MNLPFRKQNYLNFCHYYLASIYIYEYSNIIITFYTAYSAKDLITKYCNICIIYSANVTLSAATIRFKTLSI